MKWSSEEYLIAFNMLNGIAGHRLEALVKAFGSLQDAWNSSYSQLLQVPGFGPKVSKSFIEQRTKIDPIKELNWAKSIGARIYTAYNPDYPKYLKGLQPVPPVIYCLGRLPSDLGIAIVGTRKPTASGRRQAYDFAKELADYFPIVSGLARGIDTQAHLGALAAGGSTIAVLGSSLNQIYPPENCELANKISQNGCLVTEFSSNAAIKPGNFPRRNRLIAAFSKGVLVVEAGEKSGTMSTVDWALEQGKDVWAIPGDIANPLRKGTNKLIKQGAGLVDSPQDILDYFQLVAKPLVNKLDQTLQLVLKYYRQGYSTDEIVEITKIPINKVQSSITILQVEGY
ncbi:MAG: DNA-protecting protein DprA [Firmicutes bacterium]|nr:DNA-protecting protein DprA [Bacillota bacterium]